MCLGLAATLFVGAACSQSAPPGSSSTPPSASPSPAAAPPQESSAAEGGDQDGRRKIEEGHEHAAPHGGTLIELGEEFAHVELLLDSAAGTLTAYALDGEAARAVRLPQSSIELAFSTPDGKRTAATLTGVGNALTGETESDTSQFRAVVPALTGVARFEGSIKAVLVRGRRFEHVTFRYPSAEHD